MTSSHRPYFRHSTSEMRELFQSQYGNAALLSELVEELHFRSGPAAVGLRSEVGQRILVLTEPTEPAAAPPPHTAKQRSRSSDSIPLLPGAAVPSDFNGVKQEPELLEPAKKISADEIIQGSDTPRNLLRRLFEYIGEQLNEVDPRGYNLSRSDFQCLPSDVAGLPGVEQDIRLEGDHVWLRIARLEAEASPKPAEEYEGLFRFSTDPFGLPPTLDETAIQRRVAEATQGKRELDRRQTELNLRNAITSSFINFGKQWNAWAEAEKPRRKTIALYSDLFSLKNQMSAEQTAKPTELVWGIGTSAWQMSSEGKPFAFLYPLLTQAVEIALDEHTMCLDIRPRTIDTRLEMDAFVTCAVSGSADVERAAREYLDKHRDRAITPFDPASYADLLKLVAANLDSRGVYKEILANGASIPEPGQHFVVTDAWVLFVRPKINNYLVEDLKRLQNTLAKGCDIPEGPLAFVSPPSDEVIQFEPINFRGLSSRGTRSGGRVPEELYFPQPYNDEQATIIQRLERTSGVTVQGPPGTGKTHTIANIICHYLATGRRVLVTSRGEPALEVLQSKIPEEIRPLTVALLTSDREGIRQFQSAIEAIQHRVSQLDPNQTRIAIDTIRKTIDKIHSDVEAIDRRIDEMAQAQLAELEIDGRPMRAQQLADLVVDGFEHSWFEDKLSLGSEYEPPLSKEEEMRLREARRTLGFDLVYLSADLPAVDSLPSAAAVAEMHNVLCQIQELDEERRSGRLLPLKELTPEVLNSARSLLEEIEAAISFITQMESFDATWPLELRAKCRQPSFASEREALEALFFEVDRFVEMRVAFLRRPVEFPEAGLSSVKAKEAISRGVQTGKPFGAFTLGAAEAKELLTEVKINGLPPSGAADWAHVQNYVSLHEALLSFSARWNQLAEILGIPKLEGGISSLRVIEQTALAARNAYRIAKGFDVSAPKEAKVVFDQVPVKQLLGGSADLQTIRTHLLRHLTRAELTPDGTGLNALQEKFAGSSGAISEEFRQFLKNDLGSRTLDAALVSKRFNELTNELSRIFGLSEELSIVRKMSARLEKAGAPRFATRIQSIPISEGGKDTTFPESWREAWTWARIKTHLDSIEAREEFLTLAARRRELESGLARLYKDMVAKSAWLATKRNATSKVLQALAGYATAIRRIGQGTGPNAVRYRRDAQDCMLDAASAVPCWIMSHSKISESMPPEIGAFDLVIVDEAGQSDLWALPAIVRGKKILIVGDDKQVSPDSGFIASQRIDELKQRFLSGQPYGIEMTPEKSLYDLAGRVFAAEQVMLREHFRCVPAIIAYSNSIFYKEAIYPLRIPTLAERIDPPLVDILVEGGRRDSNDCNDLEAEAIADEIAAILRDPKFARRSIGVVSLLGMEQAKRIDTTVRNRCPAGELLQRKFECGDARTFQGSERDIMFLSMVVDRKSCKALSGNMFEQRFNVAASRARDRMYMVRSINRSDLSEKDLRITLLNYFDKPQRTAGNSEENLLALCESSFEKELFSRLVECGYRVVPQVKSGAYRIDMVVEGEGDARLAIECDGDDYHTHDRWPHDMHCQRVLERVGWTFWRCFASTWTLRKDEIFNELRHLLTAMGIEPRGALTKAPNLVEKRTWRSSETAKDSEEVPSAIETVATEQRVAL